MPKLIVLWTDAVFFLMVIAALFYIGHARKSPTLRATWRKVAQEPSAMAALVIVLLFLVIALLDSIHFRRMLPPAPGTAANTAAAYSTKTESVLDVLLARQIAMRETSYSLPMATQTFTKESREVNGQVVRERVRLDHGGAHLKDAERDYGPDVGQRVGKGVVGGLLAAFCFALLVAAGLAASQQRSIRDTWRDILTNQTDLPWRTVCITVTVVCLLAGPVITLMDHYHVLGTDRTGNDVLYQALKSIRTAFVIGTLTTLSTLPFAVVLGVMAGYFRGWVDDVIQYLYTTLSSIPNVLLIAACVLMIQVFIDKNPQLFDTGAERADLKLFFLCLILGLTGWAGLCRLLRAETMKLRELDYVQAAQAFGVSPWRIMARHILPNVTHLILITTVLDFSTLVLYEAVLSYVGVGVDPSMSSFGGMINLARSEMSREPVVWWSFMAAFAFMVALVLAFNLLADAVQAAFDPRTRKFRAKLRLFKPAAA
jgi:peptide/nickel transport system permease protein